MSKKLTSGASPSEVAAALTPLVAFGADGVETAVLRTMLQDNLLPHLMQYDRPEFQSMFNAFLPEAARLGADIALDFNQGVTNWQVSPGGAMLEELCVQALCRLFGLAKTADATFMYSGTYANQQAVYLALHRFAKRQGFNLTEKGVSGFMQPDKLAILVSEDAHFSLRHAVRNSGLGEQCLYKVPTDQNRRMDADSLRELAAKLRPTHHIFCIVATSGTTSTGAVDPIAPIVELCEQIGAWCHVDGAYGYAYKLVPEWAHLFTGDDRADSVTWDPHKQLGAPIPSSLLFVKDGADLGRMSLYSDYFNREEDVEPNPGLKSPPSTRSLAALPLVTLLRGQGLRRVVADLRVPLTAVSQLATYLQTQPDFELLHQPDTGILCFRATPPHLPESAWEPLQRRLYDQIMQSGERSISLTKVNGRSALRVVSVSPQTKFEHFLDTIETVRKLAAKNVDSEFVES